MSSDRSAESAAAFNRGCPTCGVGPWSSCKSKSGRSMTYAFHKARMSGGGNLEKPECAQCGDPDDHSFHDHPFANPVGPGDEASGCAPGQQGPLGNLDNAKPVNDLADACRCGANVAKTPTPHHPSCGFRGKPCDCCNGMVLRGAGGKPVACPDCGSRLGIEGEPQ